MFEKEELLFQICQEQLEILLVVSYFESNSYCFDSEVLNSDDFVEGVGIKNTLKEIKSADLVIGVFEIYNKDTIHSLRICQKTVRLFAFKTK